MKTERMSWAKLLNTTRFRPTQKVTGEVRDEFERDYGRSLYSTPVRRLRDKAQVFPLEPHDAVRTRLAHSLEVSSVAESLCLNAAREVPKAEGLSEDQQRAIACIARTCGLIHDLGSPPFGHAGELAISSWFKKKLESDERFAKLFEAELTEQQRADFLNFEGNAQNLRLACHLQLLTDEHGLNLTYGTLSAASKYLAASHEASKNGPHQYRKPGYFASEHDVVNAVREATGTGSRRNPITYLVEAADDIVYSTVDIEDGLKKKVLVWEDVADQLKNCALGRSIIQTTGERVNLPNLLHSERREAYPVVFRTVAISVMAPEILKVFAGHYEEIMHGEYNGELVSEPDCKVSDFILRSKKNLLRRFLYTDSSILKLEVRGRAVIHGLMDLFWEAASASDSSDSVDTHTYAGKLFLLISPNYRKVFQNRFRLDQEPKLYLRLQLVTDQIAGMTDTYACRLHKELFNGS